MTYGFSFQRCFKILQNTFIHIPGITKDTEIDIWNNDILNWQEFLSCSNNLNLRSKDKAIKTIKNSIQAYDNKDFKFFKDLLSPNEHWRLYNECKDKCCFLDIETTGLSRERNRITLIGIYNGKESKIFINGKNLEKFEEEIKKYDMIITFNGRCFDLPFIKHKFPSVDLDKIHIDLRFLMRDLGFSGGLKNIEREIGISRDEEIGDISGSEAVRLWKKYERGDTKALDILLKYNIADIENLKVMMDFAFSKIKDKNFTSRIM